MTPEGNIVKIKLLLSEGHLCQEVMSKPFGVSDTVINYIYEGKSWQHA